MLVFVLFLLVIAAAYLGLIAFSLLTVRIHPTSRARSIDWQEIPEDLVEQLMSAAQQLQALGFSPEAYLQWADSSLSSDPSTRILFLDESKRVGAALIHRSIAGLPATHAVMYSWPSPDLAVVTSVAPVFDFADKDHLKLIVGKFADAGEQFDAHVEATKEITNNPIAIQPTELRNSYLALSDQYNERQIASGKMTLTEGHPDSDARISLSAIPQYIIASLLWKVRGTQKLFVKNWASPPAPSRTLTPTPPPKTLASTPGDSDEDDIPRWLTVSNRVDYRSYLSQKKAIENAPKLKLRGKSILFLVSLITTLLLLKLLGTLDNAAIASLVVILFVHELGHYTMMKIFGYDRLSIVFIPLLGAAATGKKENAPAWQEFWVLIMGPMPGLLAAFAIIIAGYFIPSLPDWLLTAASLSILINGLNLLPFNPLDGGRIVDLLLFKRVPSLRPIFLLLAALACIGFGVLLSSFILGGIGVFQLFRFSSNLRASRLVTWVNAAITPEMDQTQKVVSTIGIAREQGTHAIFEKTNWALEIDKLIEWATSQRMGAFATISALGLHASLFLLPVVGTAGIFGFMALATTLEMKTIWEKDKIASMWKAEIIPPAKQTSAENDDLLNNLQANQAIYSQNYPEDIREHISQNASNVSTALEDIRLIDWSKSQVWLHDNDFYGNTVFAPALNLLVRNIEDPLAQVSQSKTMKDIFLAVNVMNDCEPNWSQPSRGIWFDSSLKTLELLLAAGRSSHISEKNYNWCKRKLSLPLKITPELVIADQVGSEDLAFNESLGYSEKDTPMVREFYKKFSDSFKDVDPAKVASQMERDRQYLIERRKQKWSSSSSDSGVSEHLVEFGDDLEAFLKKRSELVDQFYQLENQVATSGK